MKESTFQPPGKKPLGSSVRPNELLAQPGKKALDLILESPTPARLVQSLAEEDLFWLVRDIGPEDALPVLSLASNDQWQYLLDLELWKKIQDKFAESVNVPIQTLDENANIVMKSKEFPFYCQIVQHKQIGNEKCQSCRLKNFKKWFFI